MKELLQPTTKEELISIFKDVSKDFQYNHVTDYHMRNIKSVGYTDQDGDQHILFYNGSEYTDIEIKKYMRGIYNTIFGTGEMCFIRSRKWTKAMSMIQNKTIITKDGIKVEISFLTVVSIMILLQSRLIDDVNMFSIMSHLTFWLDSIEL